MRKEDNSYQQQPQQYYPPQPSNYTIWVPNNPNIEAYRRARESATFGPGYMQQNPYNRGYGSQPQPYGMPQQQPYGMPPQQYGEQPQNKKGKKNKGPKVYKTRRPILIILALLMIVAIVVNILPILGVMGQFTAPFIARDASAQGDDWKDQLKYLSFADPIVSLVKSFSASSADKEKNEDEGIDTQAVSSDEDEDADKDKKTSMFTSQYYTDCLSKMDEYKSKEEGKGDITKAIAFTAMPIVIILFMILSVYLAVKLIMAAVKGKKMKFGYSYLVGIIYLVAIAFITVMWNGQGMGGIGAVFATPISVLTASGEEAPTMASKAAVGLGFYITAIIYVLSLILNFFSYKRIKNAQPQQQQYPQY